MPCLPALFPWPALPCCPAKLQNLAPAAYMTEINGWQHGATHQPSLLPQSSVQAASLDTGHSLECELCL